MEHPALWLSAEVAQGIVEGLCRCMDGRVGAVRHLADMASDERLWPRNEVCAADAGRASMPSDSQLVRGREHTTHHDTVSGPPFDSVAEA